MKKIVFLSATLFFLSLALPWASVSADDPEAEMGNANSSSISPGTSTGSANSSSSSAGSGGATEETAQEKFRDLIKPEANLPLPKLQEDSAEDQANYFIFKVIDLLLFLAGLVAVFFIVLGGVRFVVAAGSEEEIDKAKNTLIWAILGLLAVIFSWAIVENVVKIALAGG